MQTNLIIKNRKNLGNGMRN